MSRNQFQDIANTSKIRNVFKLKTHDSALLPSGVQTVIMFAIRKNIKIDFYYEDDENGAVVLKGYREASPVAIGSHVSTGNMVFRAYLMEGVSKSKRIPKWRMFRCDRVKSIILNWIPQRARMNKLYRMNDKHMGDILVQAQISKKRKTVINT